MVQIHDVFTTINTQSTVPNPLIKPANKVVPQTGPQAATQTATQNDEATPEPGSRVILDRVEISGATGKMVNLARGQDLAEEFRSKPVDDNFASDLGKALEDISRITRLFSETVKGLFQSNQR